VQGVNKFFGLGFDLRVFHDVRAAFLRFECRASLC